MKNAYDLGFSKKEMIQIRYTVGLILFHTIQYEEKKHTNMIVEILR